MNLSFCIVIALFVGAFAKPMHHEETHEEHVEHVEHEEHKHHPVHVEAPMKIIHKHHYKKVPVIKIIKVPVVKEVKVYYPVKIPFKVHYPVIVHEKKDGKSEDHSEHGHEISFEHEGHDFGHHDFGHMEHDFGHHDFGHTEHDIGHMEHNFEHHDFDHKFEHDSKEEHFDFTKDINGFDTKNTHVDFHDHKEEEHNEIAHHEHKAEEHKQE